MPPAIERAPAHFENDDGADRADHDGADCDDESDEDGGRERMFHVDSPRADKSKLDRLPGRSSDAKQHNRTDAEN